MTAVLAVSYPDRVEIAADAAVLDENAKVVRITSKIFSAPSGKVVVTGRGRSIDLISMIATGIMMNVDALGFDKAMVELQRLLDVAPEQKNETELIIAGLSEREGMALKFVTLTALVDEIPPRRVIEVPGYYYGGPYIGEFSASDLEDLSQTGAGILEMARSTPGKNLANPDSVAIFGVGGFAEHVVISAEGCTRNVLRRWSDCIGEAITPRWPACPDLVAAAALEQVLP